MQKSLTLFCIINLIITFYFWFQLKPSYDKEIQDFNFTVQMIQNQYVDESHQKVSSQKLFNYALRGLLSDLDSNTYYMEPEILKELTQITEGKIGGIGVVIEDNDSGLLILDTVPNAPAQAAGIEANDIIISVSDQDITEMDFKSSTSLIKGEIGTSVNIGILRDNQKQIFLVERQNYSLPSAKQCFILKEKFLYVVISEFSTSTADNFFERLENHEGKYEGIIIDVRENPGGLIHTAVEICDYFLPENKLIVSTVPRNPKHRSDYFSSSSKPKDLTTPLIILQDRNSASASELLAGSLRDNGRATIIGTQSFGKGSVQSVLHYPKSGNGFRITIAHYYTPANQKIHGVGITPDIEIPLDEGEYRKLQFRLKKFNVKIADFSEDPHITRAIEELESKLEPYK